MIYKKQVANTSSWETDSLIKIIEKCAEHRGIDLRERLRTYPKRGEKPFRIKHSCGWGDKTYRGRCYGLHIDGNPKPSKKGEIYIGVPYSDKVSGFNKQRFAEIVLHEIDHLLGLKHDEMMHSGNLSLPNLDRIQVTEK